ncbi:MAG: septum formation initiator family protein [Pseudomonadota bacterium]|nr:septum formation initiator family protein [Pseudomonadota bacterium]
MPTRQRRNNLLLKSMAIPAICSLLIAYFLFHAWSGRYGIEAMRELGEERTRLEFELVRLKEKRKALEARAMLLRDGTIEKDMLDEQARHMLNLAGPDELIILR